MDITTEETPLQALIRELGLHMEATFIPRSCTDNAKATKLHEMKINWRVLVYRQNRHGAITTPYFEGIGHLPAPIRPRDLGHVTTDEYHAIVAGLETGKVRRSRGGFSVTALKPPTITDVLYCLVNDASAIDYPSFEEWAESMGYDADSRSAEATYRACVGTGLALLAMLGSDGLARLRDAFQDY